jgi:hypothetical protein
MVEHDARLQAKLGLSLYEIYRERVRQIVEEKYTIEHDLAHHGKEELIAAARCYLIRPELRSDVMGKYIDRARWPFEESAWKPTPDDRIRELIKAAALIAAEIDRLLIVQGKAIQPEMSEVQDGNKTI